MFPLPTATRPLDPRSGVSRSFDYGLWMVTLTAARLAFVPFLVASFMASPVMTSGGLIAFVGLDIYDGVLARRCAADGLRRRALDSIVDRLAIDSCLIGAFAVGALPLVLLVAFLARDAYCAGLCAYMMRRRRTAIKADWLYRSLNLSVATWAVAAPFAGATGREVSALAVLLFSVIVAADLTRLVRAVVRAPEYLHDTVVSASAARRRSF